MIEKGGFWDADYTKEYKSEYGDYKVLSRTVEVDQVLMSIDAYANPQYTLLHNGMELASVKNAELEAKRVSSVFHRKGRRNALPETIVNLDENSLCRVIEPTHGRVATSSGDRRLICGNENDVQMTRSDFQSETERRWF